MKQTQKLLMMKGLPCSGKTEWAYKWAESKRNRVRISWTDIMNSIGRKTRERRILSIEATVHLMIQSIKSGFDVVLDECNLNPLTFNIFITRALFLGCQIEWHNMNKNIDECKRRNAELGHPVDDMEIERLYKEWKVWLEE